MTPRLLETVLREAAARAADSGDGSLPDADLLRRYAEDRDESSFAALVSRYGRVVWAVCRQSLPNEADAEDAFQATFLALSRGAGTVRSSLPGWLHGVAVKVCAQARRSAGRRKVRDARAAVSEAERPVAESAWDGLLAEVHAEVTRLPAALRDAFVLVDLRGISQPEAAKTLGWKIGTLSGRLCQARQFLVDRLTARGLAPAAALAGCGVGAVAANAAVPSKLFAAACAAGSANATIPAGVSLLASAALEGSVMFKTKLLAAGVMLATAAAITVASAQGPGEGSPQPTPKPRPVNRDRVDRAEQPARDGPRGGETGAPGQPGGRPPGMPDGGMAGGPGMGGMPGGFNPVRPGFEYKVVPVKLSSMEKGLNDFGNDHWELVSINGEGSGGIWYATFKRMKPVAFAGGGFGGGGGGMMMGGSGGMPGMFGGGGGSGGGAGPSGPGGMPARGGGGRPGGGFPGGGGDGGPGFGRPAGSGDGEPLNDGSGRSRDVFTPPGPVLPFPSSLTPGGGGDQVPPPTVLSAGEGIQESNPPPFVGGGGGRGGFGGNASGRRTIVNLDTPNLDAKKVAASINQLFSDRGISASEAPDGNGIVMASTGRAQEVEQVKKFVQEYVDKAAARLKEERENNFAPKARQDAIKKKNEGEDTTKKKGG